MERAEGGTKSTRPPEKAQNSGDFAPAVAEAAPEKPVRIVTIPEPLPLPGQLKPLPDGKPTAPDKRPPITRVEAANRAARLEPTKDGYVNAVQIYPFTQGALYRLSAAPKQVSDIALPPGEELIAPPAGNTGPRVVGGTHH